MYTPYKYFKGLETKQLIVQKLPQMNKFRHEKKTFSKSNFKPINRSQKKNESDHLTTRNLKIDLVFLLQV